jgi:hypothetical protein
MHSLHTGFSSYPEQFAVWPQPLKHDVRWSHSALPPLLPPVVVEPFPSPPPPHAKTKTQKNENTKCLAIVFDCLPLAYADHLTSSLLKQARTTSFFLCQVFAKLALCIALCAPHSLKRYGKLW